jgi:predicted O-methyltransferase YrrM
MLPPLVRKYVKSLARLVPEIDRVLTERDRLRDEVARLEAIRAARDDADADAPQFVPPGHFYSPVARLAEVRRDAARIFARPRTFAGIDLDEPGQLALLEELAPLYRDMPFPEQRTAEFRYFYENPAYSYSDAVFLHCMIRHEKPKRIIEVGSGYSSAMMLDTNELYCAKSIQCTFIEPYPELLHSLLRADDRQRVEILPIRVQDVALARFEALEAGDILFIDSTHVARPGGDVNYLYFEVLPRLKPGVLVHVHDVFAAFEYPEVWVHEGRNWNEVYLLRAFLVFNGAFRVRLFNTFLERFHRDWFERQMPLCLKNEGGSIWLQRRDGAAEVLAANAGSLRTSARR